MQWTVAITRPEGGGALISSLSSRVGYVAAASCGEAQMKWGRGGWLHTSNTSHERSPRFAFAALHIHGFPPFDMQYTSDDEYYDAAGWQMSGVPRSALLVAQTNYADSRRPLAAAGKVSAAECELARCCTEHPWPCAILKSLVLR